MKRRLTGLRTIRQGKVKFFGKWYAPNKEELPYNGELDGQRWFFIGYQPHADALALWGDEKRFRASRESDEAYKQDCSSRTEANVTKDGGIHWYVWEPVT